jgi:hypothetical protein
LIRSFSAADGGRLIIETVSAFANEPAANEPFKSPQRALILRRRETERVSHRVRAASAADAMDVILGMFGKVVIDDV